MSPCRCVSVKYDLCQRITDTNPFTVQTLWKRRDIKLEKSCSAKWSLRIQKKALPKGGMGGGGGAGWPTT